MSKGKPIEIRGKRYRSRAAAARALGISPRTLAEAVENNRLERVGLGRKPAKPKPLEPAPKWTELDFSVDDVDGFLNGITEAFENPPPGLDPSPEDFKV